jgi:hypothetical protein
MDAKSRQLIYFNFMLVSLDVPAVIVASVAAIMNISKSLYIFTVAISSFHLTCLTFIFGQLTKIALAKPRGSVLSRAVKMIKSKWVASARPSVSVPPIQRSAPIESEPAPLADTVGLPTQKM